MFQSRNSVERNVGCTCGRVGETGDQLELCVRTVPSERYWLVNYT